MIGQVPATSDASRWANVAKLPPFVSSWGIKMEDLFESCRYRVQALRDKRKGAALEYRIPCKYGDVYPVSADLSDTRTWGWSGQSRVIGRRVAGAMGEDGSGPFGGPLILDVEQVIWFPERRVEEVLAIVGGRHRRRPNSVKNTEASNV